jgi:hypothetical protein
MPGIIFKVSNFGFIILSSVGIATGYGLDDQEGREFESR